jgi:transposase
MSDHQFWLTEAQFSRLQPLLPNKPRGVPRVDDRRVISAMVHVIRGGLMWRDAPRRLWLAQNPPQPLRVLEQSGRVRLDIRSAGHGAHGHQHRDDPLLLSAAQ